MKVKDIMTKDLTAVEKDRSLEALVFLLDKSELSGVPVIDQQGVVVGFISERDIVSAALPNYFEMLRTATYLPDIDQVSERLEEIREEPVSKYMSEDVVTVSEDEGDIYVADLIVRNQLKRIPVVDEQDRLVGIARRIDLLDSLL